MDVYGYCGQSAINELADFKDDVNNLEQLDRAMRNAKHKKKDKINYMKLTLAASVATGLSHIHSVDPLPTLKSSIDEDNNIPPRAKMAHYDINPRNIAVVKGGKPKINDFNIAEFLYTPKDNNSNNNDTVCGFPSRLHEPWWRAPEEMYIPPKGEELRKVTEKVDVYALGGVLFHILTTHSPRGKMKRERMELVREQVARGERPILPEPYLSSNSTAVKAFRKAMDRCFVVNPNERGSSHEVASILQEALLQYNI